MKGAIQRNLTIISETENKVLNGKRELSQVEANKIIVDDLRVAQFIYLLLHNEKIRTVVDTNRKKAVLILGRFTEKRKAVLRRLWNELRKRGFLPILFDFEKPSGRNLTETVSTLAHLARFIIAVHGRQKHTSRVNTHR